MDLRGEHHCLAPVWSGGAETGGGTEWKTDGGSWQTGQQFTGLSGGRPRRGRQEQIQGLLGACGTPARSPVGEEQQGRPRRQSQGIWPQMRVGGGGAMETEELMPGIVGGVSAAGVSKAIRKAPGEGAAAGETRAGTP